MYSPSLSGGKGGLRVLQQDIPHRRSSIRVIVTPSPNGCLWSLHTGNVLRLEINPLIHYTSRSVNSCGPTSETRARSYELDGQEINTDTREGSTVCFAYSMENHQWHPCKAG